MLFDVPLSASFSKKNNCFLQLGLLWPRTGHRCSVVFLQWCKHFYTTYEVTLFVLCRIIAQHFHSVSAGKFVCLVEPLYCLFCNLLARVLTYSVDSRVMYIDITWIKQCQAHNLIVIQDSPGWLTFNKPLWQMFSCSNWPTHQLCLRMVWIWEQSYYVVRTMPYHSVTFTLAVFQPYPSWPGHWILSSMFIPHLGPHQTQYCTAVEKHLFCFLPGMSTQERRAP